MQVMLSVLSYGRLVARAVIGGLSQTDSRDYSLVTASCGFGKDVRRGVLKKGMCYGDDACFVARHRSADVLGKCCRNRSRTTSHPEADPHHLQISSPGGGGQIT